ncbi:MAG: hypothetical protein A2138_13485 [Deltaproteobacteria bacterium RBG_16_71_12]|nr:MAG: hypothetical protein A2138_13485 [Deltaproteobacteria bacterium RBG_16_71_12]
MSKSAAISVRIPADLKARLMGRARRERRSLSAQIAHDLEACVAAEAALPAKRGRLLGRFRGTRVPRDEDIATVRRLLWGAIDGGRVA